MRYKVERSEAWTQCEEPHPVRFSRKQRPEHWHGESFERRCAVDAWPDKMGYVCQPGTEHTYPVWDVVDTEEDRAVETCDSYQEAKQHADDLNLNDAAKA